jgi:hypothetical protein
MVAEMGETPKHKFERLVALRVHNVEESVRKFSQLANPYIYEYGEADVDKHFASIVEALDDARRRFDDGLKRGERLRQRQGASAPAAQSGWEAARERLVRKTR